MAKGIYFEKSIKPNDELLYQNLGNSKEFWNTLLKHLEETYSNFSTEWKFYGKAMGWCLVCKDGKKQVLYLTPNKDYFEASLIFNEKAIEMAKIIGFSDDILAIIETGKTNPAGGGFDFYIDDKSDYIETVKKLVKVKQEN